KGGHNDLFELLATLIVGYGLDPERASEIAAEHYNPRCVPPFEVGSREWAHKVESATAAERDPGYLLDDPIEVFTVEEIHDLSAGKGDLWFEDESLRRVVALLEAHEPEYQRVMNDLESRLGAKRASKLDRLVRRWHRND